MSAENLLDEIWRQGEGDDGPLTYPGDAFGYLSENYVRPQYRFDPVFNGTKPSKSPPVPHRRHRRVDSLDVDFSVGKPWKAKVKVAKKEKRQDNVDVLRREIDEWRRRSTCIVCVDAGRDALFLPCCHLCCCCACAERLEACPNCRQRRIGIVEVNRMD